MDYILTGIAAWIVCKLLDIILWKNRKAIYRYFVSVYDTYRLGYIQAEDFQYPWKVFGYETYTGTYMVEIQKNNSGVDDGYIAKGNTILHLTSRQLSLNPNHYFSKDFHSV